MNKRDQELWEQALHDGERFDSAESCFADLIRADEREDILNLVQKMAARFYKDDAEKAFEELTEAIRARGNK